jgi:hypothetical protein
LARPHRRSAEGTNHDPGHRTSHDLSVEGADGFAHALRLAVTSERQGRLIDKDEAGAMEKKKQEGHF